MLHVSVGVGGGLLFRGMASFLNGGEGAHGWGINFDVGGMVSKKIIGWGDIPHPLWETLYNVP